MYEKIPVLLQNIKNLYHHVGSLMQLCTLKQVISVHLVKEYHHQEQGLINP